MTLSYWPVTPPKSTLSLSLSEICLLVPAQRESITYLLPQLEPIPAIVCLLAAVLLLLCGVLMLAGVAEVAGTLQESTNPRSLVTLLVVASSLLLLLLLVLWLVSQAMGLLPQQP